MDSQIVESPSLAPVALLQSDLRNSIMSPMINGGTEIMQGTIFAKQLVIGERNWVHNIVWTATDYDTASWGSGTLKMSDGSTFAISSGNTGNIAAATYIYFDPDVSTTTLQTTTTYSSAIGGNKILLAIVVASSDTAAKCVISAFGSEGTTIDGDKIVTGKIQSTDGKTYFDLDGKVIMVNDGTNDRVLVGYQSNGF